MSRRPARLVLLLRGINLGSQRRVGMGQLRALLEEGGHSRVRTHLQSGNVVIDTEQTPAVVVRYTERAISERFGFEVDVIARSREQLAAVVAADPLATLATDPARHIVVFLSADPDPAALRRLQATDFAPEEMRAAGREVHAWCPDGVNASPVIGAITKARLAPTTTARNWTTVCRLLALLDATD